MQRVLQEIVECFISKVVALEGAKEPYWSLLGDVSQMMYWAECIFSGFEAFCRAVDWMVLEK